MMPTTVAYAKMEILPLMMLALEMMLYVTLNGVLKENVTYNAQKLKVGPIVHALIVPKTKKPITMELPAYAMEVTMLKIIVLAQALNTPHQQLLTNKNVNLLVQVPLFGPYLKVLQPVLVLTATVVPKNFGIPLVMVLVLTAPLTLHAMELAFLVVLETSTTILPINLVLLLVKMERNGETMNANVPLLKKLLEMNVLPVPEIIKLPMELKMIAYAKMGMHLTQVEMTHMVANSNPTITKKLLITEPIYNVKLTLLGLIVPLLVLGPTLILLLLMVLLLLANQNVAPVKKIMLEMLVNSTALLTNTKTVLMMINLPVNVTLIIGYGIMTA